MKALLAIAVVATLAGCQANKPLSELTYTELKQVAVDIEKRCADQGAPRGSPNWDVCTKQEVTRENARRNRIASSAGPTVCTAVGYTVICN